MFAPYKTEKPDAPVKARKFAPTLDGLIAWLETQSPETAYSYMDCQGACLLGQFYAACGLPWRKGGSKIWLRDDLKLGPMSAQHPRTFGAALERTLAIRARQS